MAMHAPMSPSKYLVFGSQVSASPGKLFDSLRSAKGDDDLGWVFETIAHLPEQRRSIAEHYPELESDSFGADSLIQLRDWLKDTAEERQWTHVPNIVLTPVVVATQLLNFTKTLAKGSSYGLQDNYCQDAQCLGLCTGLLSAIVVACSKDAHHLRKYGAVAIRLAMLVGAVVDAQEVRSHTGKSSSFVVTCSTPSVRETVVRSVEADPEVSLVQPTTLHTSINPRLRPIYQFSMTKAASLSLPPIIDVKGSWLRCESTELRSLRSTFEGNSIVLFTNANYQRWIGFAMPTPCFNCPMRQQRALPLG